MKISVITVAYNAEKTIEDTLRSVQKQNYPNVEYIVVDGGSNDGTVDIIKSNSTHIHAWVSEPDKGIYDAMNKGIMMATGDVIGFLNADDIYADRNVLTKVAQVLSETQLNACFADLQFMNKQGKKVRHYSSARFEPKHLRSGWMPAHPTLYVRKSFFEKVGKFKLSYQIAADYEWIIRAFLIHKACWKYVPEVWVYMRMGGASTRNLKSNWILNCEIVRACRENGIQTSLIRVLMKLPLKVMELVVRK